MQNMSHHILSNNWKFQATVRHILPDLSNSWPIKFLATAAKSDTCLRLDGFNFQSSCELSFDRQEKKMELRTHQLSNYVLVLVILISSSNGAKGKSSLLLISLRHGVIYKHMWYVLQSVFLEFRNCSFFCLFASFNSSHWCWW